MLLPSVDQDKKVRSLPNHFFVSITVHELLPFEKDGDGIAWNILAANLSEERIDPGALELSSFPTSICSGTKPSCCEDIDMGIDDTGGGDDGEEDSELGAEARRSASPAHLAEIVCHSSIASCLGLHDE